MRYTVSNISNFQHKFSDSGEVKTVKISDGLRSICIVGREDNEIKDLIEEFNSGDRLESILDNCFIGCKNLSSVNLQQQIKYIGQNAFKDCENLKDINIEVGKYDYVGDMAFANVGIQDVDLEMYITQDGYIGQNIFKDCKQLTAATIITNTLPARLFSGCDKLKSLKIILSNETNDDVDNIEYNAFENLTSLVDFTLCSETLHDIPLLQNMPNLKTVNIYANIIRRVPANVFYNTPSLTSIHFYSGLADTSVISPSAFVGSSLRSITFDGIELQKDNVDSLKSAMLLSEHDPGFIPVDGGGSEQYEYVVASRNAPTALMKHISQPDNGKYYYGKIYDDFDSCLTYAVNNKIPVLFIRAPIEAQIYSKHLLTRKMFYEFLNQQKCLICCVGDKLKLDAKIYDTVDCTYTEQSQRYGTSTNGPFFEDPGIDLTGHKGTNYSQSEYIKRKLDGSITVTNDKKDDNITTVWKFWKGNNYFYINDREYNLLTEETTFELASNRKRVIFTTVTSSSKNRSPYSSTSSQFSRNTIAMLIVPKPTTNIETTKYSEHAYMKHKKQKFANVTVKDLYDVDVYMGLLDPGIYGPGSMYLKYGGTDLYGPGDLRDLLANWKYAKYVKEQNLRDSTYTCHYDCETKTRIMIIDDQLRELLKNYQRDPRFNAPGWVEDSKYCPKDGSGNRLPLMLDYKPAKDTDFTFFGIGHDCTIKDKNGQTLKWLNVSKKLS